MINKKWVIVIIVGYCVWDVDFWYLFCRLEFRDVGEVVRLYREVCDGMSLFYGILLE